MADGSWQGGPAAHMYATHISCRPSCHRLSLLVALFVVFMYAFTCSIGSITERWRAPLLNLGARYEYGRRTTAIPPARFTVSTGNALACYHLRLE